MFNDYHNKYPLYDEKKLPAERISADKSEVFSRLGLNMKNDTAVSKRAASEEYYGESIRPTAKKASPLRFIAPIAAAAVIAAAVPLCMRYFGKSSVVADPAAGSVISETSENSETSETSKPSKLVFETIKDPAYYYDVRSEYRVKKGCEDFYGEDASAPMTTVSLDGRVYGWRSVTGCIPSFDTDLSCLRQCVPETVTYEDLRRLPSLGKGFITDGAIELNELVHTGKTMYDLCRYDDNTVILRRWYRANEENKDINDVPDDEIQYLFFTYSHRFTQTARAAKAFYIESLHDNSFGIKDLAVVYELGDPSSAFDMLKVYTEVTMADGDPEAEEKYQSFVRDKGLDENYIRTVYTAPSPALLNDDIISDLGKNYRQLALKYGEPVGGAMNALTFDGGHGRYVWKNDSDLPPSEQEAGCDMIDGVPVKDLLIGVKLPIYCTEIVQDYHLMLKDISFSGMYNMDMATYSTFDESVSIIIPLDENDCITEDARAIITKMTAETNSDVGEPSFDEARKLSLETPEFEVYPEGEPWDEIAESLAASYLPDFQASDYSVISHTLHDDGTTEYTLRNSITANIFWFKVENGVIRNFSEYELP